MARSPEEILNYLPLSASVELVKTGIPKVLPDAFWSTTEKVLGDKANYIQYQGTRQVAKIAPYGAPPRQADKISLTDKSVKLLHATEKLAFSQDLFRVFRQWEKYEPQQMMASQHIEYQGLQFRQRFDNLRLAAVTSTLANGVLYFDSSGNLLPTSSGADLTLDQGVPAGNKDQVGGIISASWATAATDIVGHVNALKRKAVQDTGYPLKYAFYGKNIPSYLANNTGFGTFLSRNNPTRNEQFVSTGLIPEGILDLTWVPVQNGFFEDSGGTVRSFFGDDAITFAPEINASTYVMFEGSYLVPSSFGLFADSMAALRSMSEVYGMGRYAYLDVPPTQIFDVAFDTFMPLLRVPKAFFMCDVTP